VLSPQVLWFRVQLIWLAGLSLCYGQGIEAERRRLETKLNTRTLENSVGNRSDQTQSGLDLSLVASMAYDDNIFLEAEDEVGSAVARLEPTIGWTVGNREATWLRLAYAGSAVYYLSESEENRLDNRFVSEGGIQFNSLSFAYSGRWARLATPTADVGGAVTRDDWSARLSASYRPKGKWSYEVYAEKNAVDQNDSSGIDVFETSGGILANYRYSSKTEFRASYRIGQVDGVDVRSYQSGDGVDPYLSLRAEWIPANGVLFFGEGFIRENTSIGVEGENFELLGFQLGANLRIRDGWRAGLVLGVEHADYFSVTGLPDSGRADTLFFIRPSISYAFSNGSELVFLYQWARSDSTIDQFGYDNQQLGVSLNYRF